MLAPTNERLGWCSPSLVHIQNQADLSQRAHTLREQSRKVPLIPANFDSANDVYLTDDLVFKPVDSFNCELCYKISQLAGPEIEKTLVPTKKGKATVIAPEDLRINYKILNDDRNIRYLVDQKVLNEIDSENDQEVENESDDENDDSGWKIDTF